MLMAPKGKWTFEENMDGSGDRSTEMQPIQADSKRFLRTRL